MIKYHLAYFLDISKVFDTLDHTILREKLKYYRVDGAAHWLFKSYLKVRKQYVDIGGASSEMKPIITGVPQGSILGPLQLFIAISIVVSRVVSSAYMMNLKKLLANEISFM